MTAKERVLSLRIMNMIQQDPAFSQKIGISVKMNEKDDSKKIKEVKNRH